MNNELENRQWKYHTLITDGPLQGRLTFGPYIGTSMDFLMGSPRTDFIDAKEMMDEAEEIQNLGGSTIYFDPKGDSAFLQFAKTHLGTGDESMPFLDFDSESFKG